MFRFRFDFGLCVRIGNNTRFGGCIRFNRIVIPRIITADKTASGRQRQRYDQGYKFHNRLFHSIPPALPLRQTISEYTFIIP